MAAPTAAPARTGRTAPPGTAAVAASASLGFGTDLPDASNTTLTDYGTAPRLLKIAAWLNTPGGRPLSLASLKGKVVLVDFWTYSCINCQRALPHLEAWYREYSKYGLVVIGVHTPEFAFERVIGNVRRAARSLGVDYPVAIDNSYLTWENYGDRGVADRVPDRPDRAVALYPGRRGRLRPDRDPHPRPSLRLRGAATPSHRRPRPDPERDHHPRDVPRYFRAATVRRYSPRAGGDGKLRLRPRAPAQLRFLPGDMDQ